MIKGGPAAAERTEPDDTYCSPEKQYLLLKMMLTHLSKRGEPIGLGVPVAQSRRSRC